MLIHTIVITPTWFMQMHILVFANKYALNTLSNVDVRYIHLYANVLFMHILMWVFFICRLFALACVIVQKKQGWWSLSPFLLPSLFRPIAILNKLIEKRGCKALIRIKELVNDPNITGRQSCKPEAEWSEKRVRLENTETRQARNRWWCWWSRGTQGRKEQTNQTPWFWKLPGCQR